MGPFEVSKEMVASLGDVELRELLARLLEAEARDRGISAAAVSVGGNQNAADGGVDASIVWHGNPEPEGWLPRRTIYFQSKAEGMSATKLKNEMRPRGVARPIFEQLAACGGAYIVFSTDDPSHSAEEDRIAAMRAAVEDVDPDRAISLHFLGADRIARWVNNRAGVALWLLEKAGHPRAGWRGYGGWSADGADERAYLLDDENRASVGEVPVDLLSAIRSMRTALSSPGHSVRLLGLSGMGKTRLAEALFDDSIDPPHALSRDRAIYGDAGLDLSVSPALLAEKIAVSGTDAIIVVDNCNDLVHGQLAEIIRRTGRVSLLTIDYDASGDDREGLVVVLGENSEAVLQALLEQRFPKLRKAERERLSAFSGGNARIALKIAEAGDDTIDLSTLKDGELLDRLFRSGRRADDPALRSAADAAALVTAFYIADGRGHAAEHGHLASIAELSVAKFYAAGVRLLDWGVMQKRGPQRAVMPPPLANMLAAPAIQRSDPDALVAHFLSGPPRLFSSFARRVGQLHNDAAAVSVARRLFAAGGALGDPATLSSDLHEAFINAAPAAPEAALFAIERSVMGANRERLLAPTKQRKALAELLVLIGHDAPLFDRVVELLAMFAKDDPDSGDNSVRAHLLERFWPVLSFTMANLDMKMDAIDRLISDPEESVRILGVEALGHALSTGQFSSSLNLEFGARSRLSEWRPENGDFRPWFDAVYTRLTAIAGGGNEMLADRARTIVAKHFRSQLDAGLKEKAIPALRAVMGNGYFEQGWRAVNDALHFAERSNRRKAVVDETQISELRSLERDLRPRTLDELFDTFVAGKPWSHWHPSGREKKTQRNVTSLARAIGRCIGRSGLDPAPYLERAANVGRSHSVWPFMIGLARSVKDPEPLWKQAHALFVANPEQCPPALLGGLIEGANGHAPQWVQDRLNSLIDDPVLGEHIVTLHFGVPLDGAAVSRFNKKLAKGDIAVERFATLAFGGVSKPIPGNILADFLQHLIERDEGVGAALDILNMRLFGDRNDKVPLDSSLIAFGRAFLTDPRVFRSDRQADDHDVGEIGKAVLDADDDPELTRRICIAMRSASGEHYASDTDYVGLAELLMARHPRVVLEEIAEKSTSNYLLARFLGPLGSNDDGSDIDPEEGIENLLHWVGEAAQERATRLAGFVRYAVSDKANGQLRWSKIALALIAAAPDPRSVLAAFEHRFPVGAGWGPIALRYVRRKPLAEHFLKHEDERLRAWGRSANRNLDRSIQHWDQAERDSESLFE